MNCAHARACGEKRTSQKVLLSFLYPVNQIPRTRNLHPLTTLAAQDASKSKRQQTTTYPYTPTDQERLNASRHKARASFAQMAKKITNKCCSVSARLSAKEKVHYTINAGVPCKVPRRGNTPFPLGFLALPPPVCVCTTNSFRLVHQAPRRTASKKTDRLHVRLVLALPLSLTSPQALHHDRRWHSDERPMLHPRSELSTTTRSVAHGKTQ